MSSSQEIVGYFRASLLSEQYLMTHYRYVDPAKIRSTKRNSRPMSSDTLFPHIGASRISKIGT